MVAGFLHSPSHELGPAWPSEPSRGRADQRVATHILPSFLDFRDYASSIASVEGEKAGLWNSSWAVQVHRAKELAVVMAITCNGHCDWDGYGHDLLDSGRSQKQGTWESWESWVHMARLARLVRWLHVHLWELDRTFHDDLELQSDSKPTGLSPLQNARRIKSKWESQIHRTEESRSGAWLDRSGQIAARHERGSQELAHARVDPEVGRAGCLSDCRYRRWPAREQGKYRCSIVGSGVFADCH